jgi:aldehyde dehydrogenase
MYQQALDKVSKQLLIRERYDNFIGGKWIAPTEGRYFDNPSPVTGKKLCEVPRSSAADIELALDAAHKAKDAWGKTSVAERSRILNKIADKLEANLDLLALVETLDNGKPIRETTYADMPLVVDHWRYFASVVRAQEGGISEIDHDTVAYHYHEPLGVVGQIIPWNFPILMATWKLAPALAAGNCVVLKPAEQTPLGILAVMELIADILPPGVINVVNGFGIEAGKPLAQNKRIAKIAFTGETTTGRMIMQYASDNIIPVTLELGGKPPIFSSPTSWTPMTISSTRRSKVLACSPLTRARSAPARAARWCRNRSTTNSWNEPSHAQRRSSRAIRLTPQP